MTEDDLKVYHNFVDSKCSCLLHFKVAHTEMVLSECLCRVEKYCTLNPTERV